MKNLFVLLLIAFQFTSCHPKKNQDETMEAVTDSIKVDSTSKNKTDSVAVYEGLLPCADCSGIATVLKIYEGDGTIENHKFELSTIYKGKVPEKEFVEKGAFNTERGLEADPDGTIYILNADKPVQNQIYYGYYSKDPNKIYLLDKQKRVIKSKLNYSLDLKK